MGTLVSMATDSSYRVIMGKSCKHTPALIFDRIFFILAVKEDNHNVSDEFKFGHIRPKTVVSAALERLKKISIDL